MSDRDTGAADDRAPDDRETSADDAGLGAPSEEASDDRVGEAVADALTEDDLPPAEGDDEPAETAADGGEGEESSFGDDAAAPNVDESSVFDSLQDEYDVTDFEDIEPEVERQFPGEVDFDHLVAGDVELADGDADERWIRTEEPATADSGDPPRSLGGDNAVAELVADVRSDEVGEAELDALREAIGVEAPRHMDVRLRHVQSRIDDLAAYIETLETFIDEEGTPIQILERTRDRLENLDGQMDVLKTGLVNARTERQSLEDRIAAVEESAETGVDGEHFEAELTQLRQRVDDLAEAAEGGDGPTAEELADLRADLADALAERRDLRDSIEAVREDQERIREVFESIAGEFSER